MERLNADERSKIYDMTLEFMENIYHHRSIIMPFNVVAEDFLIIKCRLLYCIKFLQNFDLHESFDKSEEIIPDCDIKSLLTNDKYEDIYDKFEESQELMNRFAYHSNQYLLAVLKQTSWNIYECVHISDYEHIPERVLEKLKDMIEIHWGMMIQANKEYFRYPAFNTESTVIKQKGFSPKDYDSLCNDIVPSENLILTNEKIERMLKICDMQKQYLFSQEYAEIQKYNCSLFEELLSACCIPNFKDKNWCCISYLMGEDQQTTETILQHTMEFESVIFLLLADMAAEDFLERYEQEKGGAV